MGAATADVDFAIANVAAAAFLLTKIAIEAKTNRLNHPRNHYPPLNCLAVYLDCINC